MYLQLKSSAIYYQKVGQGKDLIMLHGWGSDVSSFWNVINDLKKEYTLWLIDLPGFGRTDLVKDLTVTDYADLVAEFINKAKIKKPVLLGHSLGGRIGIKLAANYPNLLDKLILEDSAGIRDTEGSRKLLMWVIAKMIKYFVPNTNNLKSIVRHRFYRLLGSDYEDAGRLRQTYLNVIAEDLQKDMKKIALETLIIWGEKDQAVPLKNGKKIYQLIKNSTLEVIEDAGHFPHLQNPNQFIYYVRDFA